MHTTTHLTCSSFTCPPAPWTKVPGDPVCAATGCTKEVCCVCLTTTPCTTTTHLTCASFTCPPAPWTKVPGDPVCVATGCTKEVCCVCLTTTPCTTTTQSCTTFQCPAGWVERPQAYNLHGTPSAELCCLHPTTPPCTTTTHLTCSSFTCPPAPWTKVPGDPACAATGCTKELCCACLTTTPAPASPCTTAAPASPCTT